MTDTFSGMHMRRGAMAVATALGLLILTGCAAGGDDASTPIAADTSIPSDIAADFAGASGAMQKVDVSNGWPAFAAFPKALADTGVQSRFCSQADTGEGGLCAKLVPYFKGGGSSAGMTKKIADQFRAELEATSGVTNVTIQEDQRESTTTGRYTIKAKVASAPRGMLIYVLQRANVPTVWVYVYW